MLAEHGFHDEVMALFSVPMKHCPEVLFSSVIQSKVRKENGRFGNREAVCFSHCCTCKRTVI